MTYSFDLVDKLMGDIHQTPDTGVKFDPSSVISATILSINQNVKGKTLGWYRNMIELEKTPTHYWPLECQGQS